MKQKLSYGKGEVEISLDDDANVKFILPRKREEIGEGEEQTIRYALENPISRGLLSNEVKPGETVCILVNDITRLTRSEIFVPLLIDVLNNAGIPDRDITILFANGLHKPMSEAEMKKIVTGAVFERVNISQNDSVNSDFDYIGTTSFGNRVYANSIAMRADCLILTGGIIVHHIAGFGGGRKDIIPGCAREDTIVYNHKMIVDPKAQAGNLDDNPVHLDFTEACALANPRYLLNVLLDESGRISHAVAGDWKKAHDAGCAIAKKIYECPLAEEADVVIASSGGFPKDIDLRQSKKAFYNASKAVRSGGTIICFAECSEGVNREPDPFERWLRNYPTLTEITQELGIHADLGGINAYRVREVQEHARLILLTDIDSHLLRELGIEAYGVQDAQRVVEEVLGEAQNPKILLIPQAGLTLPKVQKNNLQSTPYSQDHP